MEARPKIAGSELVTDLFGYWPTFHDAEVVRMSLETRRPYDLGPVFLADLDAFEMTNEVAPDAA